MRSLLLFAISAVGLFAQTGAQQLLLAGAVSGGGGGTCTPGAFTHCRVATVASSQVGGSTLSNFPVLVSATLGTSRIINGSCYDVIFTSDSAGATKIPWEIEFCNPSTGVIVAWAKPASLSSSSNTSFYVFYDNSGISTPQNTGGNSPANVWSNSFAGVWHFPDGTTLTSNDSTSNAVNLSIFGTGVTATTGQVDGAAAFAATGELLNSSFHEGSANITVSCWAFSSTMTSQNGELLEKSPNNGNWALFMFGGTLFLRGSTTAGPTATAPSNSAWHHIVGTISGTTGTLYVDGASVASATVVAPLNDTNQITVGGFDLGGTEFTGSIDEARVSSVARSAGWIAAEFNNQQAGSTFLMVSSEF
jgi:hypothetical protein